MLVAFVWAGRLYLGGLDSAHTWHTHPSCPQKTLFSTPATEPTSSQDSSEMPAYRKQRIFYDFADILC